jgi:hypothetical protein
MTRTDPAKYLKAADLCRKKAPSFGNPSEWVRFAQEWEKIAQVAEALSATSLPDGQFPIGSGTNTNPRTSQAAQILL